MADVVINKELCIGCGLCVKDCSRRAIELLNDKAKVELSLCNECGHCVAVCPKNAVAFSNYNQNEILEYNKDNFHLDPLNFSNFIKFRRSIRQYNSKEIENDELHSIIEAGRYSPTAGNRQLNRYIIIRDKIDEIKELTLKTLYDIASDSNFNMEGWSGYRKMWIQLYNNYKEKNIDGLFFNSPAVVVIVSDDPTGSAEVNGGIAASRMELQANTLGLGVCYIGFFKRAVEYNPKLKEMIGIKDNEDFVLSFTLGHPNVKYQRTVNRKPANISFC